MSLNSNTVTINLQPGDTCSYLVNTQCGLPQYSFGASTAGFSIESIDYLDTNINGKRVLQTTTTTNTTKTNTTTTNTTSTNTTKTNTTTTTTNTTNTTKTNTTTPTPTPTPTPNSNTTKTNTSTTTTPSSPPSPPPIVYIATNVVPTRRSVTTTTNNGTNSYTYNYDTATTGPLASSFNPAYDTKVTFKGGIRTSTNSEICNGKNTLIFVTAYGGMNVTVPSTIATSSSRILQTTTPPPLANLTTNMTVASVYW